MELIVYVIMAGGAYVALMTRTRAVVYAWFILFVAYSLIVRLSAQTPDMAVYSAAVEAWPPPLGLFTLREPVFWLGAPLLHELIGNRVATFLIIDVLSGVLVIRAMSALDDDSSDRMMALAPTIIISYVFLLGQQNAFRQHLAFVILLWSLAARSRNQRRALGLFILSVLAHNAAAVLFGYWFDTRDNLRRRYGPLITVVGVILLAALVPFLRKSALVTTGLDTEYLYVALATVLGLLLLYANSGRLSGSRAAGLLNFVAFAPAIGVLTSVQFERVAMIFLVLMLTDLYRHHRSLRLGGGLAAHLTYAILVLPVFVFPSALEKLL